jgi:hypothetical protein
MFPQTANEQQSLWEVKVFGYELSGSLTLTKRQNAVIGKLRSKPNLTISEMIYLTQTVVGTNVTVQIGEWQNESGSWLIGVSKLGVTTILGSGFRLWVTSGLYPGISLCNVTPAQVGLTQTQFTQMQVSAYSYSVLIYGYTLTAAQLTQLNILLSANEPARSQHFIYSGLNPINEM